MQGYIDEKIKTGKYRKCLCDACNVRKLPMLIRSDLDFLSVHGDLSTKPQIDKCDQQAFLDKHQELYAGVVSHKHAEVLCELKTVEDYEQQQ